jgi:predicted PurR-regulated permease PerM
MAPTPLLPGRNNWQRALLLPLTILAWLAVIIIAFWLLGHITHALILIGLAGILSFALRPVVRLLERWISRPLAVAAAFLIGIAVLFGVGSAIVVNTAQQVSNFVANFPSIAQHARELYPQVVGTLGPLGVTAATLRSLNDQILAEIQRGGTTMAAGSLGVLRSAAVSVVDASLVLILSIYFTLSGPRGVSWLKEETPPAVRHYVLDFLDVVDQVVGGYVRGTLTMALLVGALVGAGMAILHVPYAMLLGILAFFMEFIPVVGVLISGIVSLLVTIPQGLGTTAIVLVYFVIVHILEGDVLGPRIMGKAVGIHPVTGIIALMIGSEVFGIWGALFAAPLAGLVQATVLGIWREQRLNAANSATAAARRDAADSTAVVAGREAHQTAPPEGH